MACFITLFVASCSGAEQSIYTTSYNLAQGIVEAAWKPGSMPKCTLPSRPTNPFCHLLWPSLTASRLSYSQTAKPLGKVDDMPPIRWHNLEVHSTCANQFLPGYLSVGSLTSGLYFHVLSQLELAANLGRQRLFTASQCCRTRVHQGSKHTTNTCLWGPKVCQQDLSYGPFGAAGEKHGSNALRLLAPRVEPRTDHPDLL